MGEGGGNRADGLYPDKAAIEWPIFCTYDLLHADSKTTGYRIIYYKTRYLYYYYVSGRMRDYDYGLSLLGKRPDLVTGLAAREVRTGRIL